RAAARLRLRAGYERRQTPSWCRLRGWREAPLPLGFSQVLILKVVKVLCFDTLLQVLILKVVSPGPMRCRLEAGLAPTSGSMSRSYLNRPVREMLPPPVVTVTRFITTSMVS